MKKPAASLDVDLPPFPWVLNYLWDLFQELSSGLKSVGMGPIMADWRDVQAWCEAMCLDLEPWEKKTLIRLATLRAVIQSEETVKSPPSGR